MSDPEQPNNPVTLREILQETRDEVLQWDHGLPGTLHWLLRQPALVIRHYLWQRSGRFTRPLRFLLLSVAVTILMDWLVHRQLGWRSLVTPAADLDNFLIENSAVLLLLILPIIALVFRLCFFGLQIRYVDALVTLAYTQGLINFFGALMILLLPLAPAQRIVLIVVTLMMMMYTLWAWSSVAVGPVWRRWLAALGALVLAQVANAAYLQLINWVI
ncbi:DUF3667 domain-containing protein [Permianibacter aggregans]|nr:DUF3667 domain-containing protein [Permianibacter aggregans]